MAGLGIVVGVNGSSSSRVAVNWAARRAREHASPITVVLALSSKITPMTNRLMVFGIRELPHHRAARVIDDALDIATSGLSHGEAPKVHAKVVAAEPLDTLAGLSRNAEMIVVGARRRSPWCAVRNSLGAALVSRSRCPVAIVRDSAPAMRHPAHAPVQVGMSGWARPANR